MTKKAKIQSKPPLDMKWKSTIEAKVNSLIGWDGKNGFLGGVYGRNQGHVGK
jgi:hypothetical protein